MNPQNKIEPLRISEDVNFSVITIDDKQYINHNKDKNDYEKYQFHQCDKTSDVKHVRILGTDNNNRIYAECPNCKNREYFENLINVDAAIIGDKVIYTDPTPTPSLKEVFDKSPVYQESLIELDTPLKRFIRWLMKLDKKLSKK